MVFGMLNQPEW